MSKTLKLNTTNSPMKDDLGRYRTMSLFWELRKRDERDEKYPPIFTTKDNDFKVDGVVYKSLKKIYLSYDHIPGFEYDFAMDVFGSWDHWKKLAEESQLRNEIALWRQELEIKLRAHGIKKLIEQSRGDDNKTQIAAKYLANKEYLGNNRGRPSKEEVERERKIQAGVKDTITEDAERLGITLVKSA